jgi:hypothetical protein
MRQRCRTGLRLVEHGRGAFSKGARRKRAGQEKDITRKALSQVYLSDASAAADAAELIARFGIHAGSEAAARADRSRDLGNVVHFCRWREIERMIALLSTTDPADATVH